MVKRRKCKIKEIEIVNKGSGSSHRLYFGFYFPNDNSTNYYNNLESKCIILEIEHLGEKPNFDEIWHKTNKLIMHQHDCTLDI